MERESQFKVGDVVAIVMSGLGRSRSYKRKVVKATKTIVELNDKSRWRARDGYPPGQKFPTQHIEPWNEHHEARFRRWGAIDAIDQMITRDNLAVLETEELTALADFIRATFSKAKAKPSEDKQS